MSAISARGAKKLQDELENYALSMPEAWFDTPWDDERVTKVRKKIFAIYGSQDRPSIGVRLQESHDEATALDGAAAMQYDTGWIDIPITGLDDSMSARLHDLIEESFRIIAPQALIDQLDDELTD
jgi:predicted DNA-binding protein (MmcQ/YjbR family)